MRKDINFFSSFEQIKLEQKRKTKRLLTIFIGILFLVVCIYGYIGAKIFYLNHSIKQAEEFLASPKVKEDLEAIQAKKDSISNLKIYGNNIDIALNKIALTNRVNSYFLDTFENTLPSSVFIRYLEVRKDKIILEGTAQLWESIAELTHNLEETDLFVRVHLNSVAKKKDGLIYDFSLACDLKEIGR